MPFFQYHPEILSRFPEVCGGVIAAESLTNGPAPTTLQELYLAEQQNVLARLGGTPLSELPTLAAWRGALRAFGVDPTRYRSAAEALLRRLTKKGDIPSINTLVDICNLVSIRYALPVAAFDLDAMRGGVTVCFAHGDETFNALGEEGAGQPEAGEVIFRDAAGLVIARRWCWRQSVESAAGPGSSRVLFTVESQHPGGRGVIEHALDDLLELLAKFSGGKMRQAILDADQAAYPNEVPD